MILFFVLNSTGCSLNKKTCSNIFFLGDNDNWYRNVMNTAHVRPLCITNSTEDENYRLLWLRSFHDEIMITLSKKGNNIKIRALRIGHSEFDFSPAILETINTKITVEEFKKFKALISNLNFMNQEQDQFYQKQTGSELRVIVHTDGARWIIEGADNSDVNVIQHWSDVGGNFRNAALYLIDKSKIDIDGPVY